MQSWTEQSHTHTHTHTYTHTPFHRAFQVVLVVKNLPDNAGDIRYKGSIPGSFSGGGHGNPLQYSCLENTMDREAWQATVHSVAKSWTQLSD